MPFGGGSRTCIGMRFGQAEVAVIARAILERFRLELVPGYELKIRHAPTISPREGLPVRVRAAAPAAILGGAAQPVGNRLTRQRPIQPERKNAAPIPATSVPPQNSAPLPSALATRIAVIAPMKNSGSPTSQRQLTGERPDGVRKLRLRPKGSRAMAGRYIQLRDDLGLQAVELLL